MKQVFFALYLFVACAPREKFIRDEEKFEPLDLQSGAEAKFFSLASALAENSEFLVVNFYAPDCPPCIQEIPQLNQLWSYTQKNPQVQFVAIGSSLNAIGEDMPVDKIRSEVRTMQQKFSIKYPSFVATSSQLKSWRITGFPETFVFRREGASWRLHKKHIAEVTSVALLAEMMK